MTSSSPPPVAWTNVYCPKCGRFLTELAGANRVKCKSCGFWVLAQVETGYLTVLVCLTTPEKASILMSN